MGGRAGIRLSLAVMLCAGPACAYSVLTHQAIVDSAWDRHLVPLLRSRFPGATPEALKHAHAYAYGGCIIQDMGYYPFGSRFFSDLAHYVRSADFVSSLLRNARGPDEYAFALGALAHYISDNTGHPAVNRAVPMLYPKLRARYGAEATYEDDPVAHIKTEFGFDVLQVARGAYAPQAYRDFIGFEVAKPLLERAFAETYGFELKDIFLDLDLALGTYRFAVSKLIPESTRVAWVLKKDEIGKLQPGMTEAAFLYRMSPAAFRSAWGNRYRRPGFGARLLAALLRVVPKFGPFRSVDFKPPTPEAEKLFLAAFDETASRYRTELARRKDALPDLNLDTGRPARFGSYRLADKTYAKLVRKLAKAKPAGPGPELLENIRAFYAGAPARSRAWRRAESLR